MYTYNGDPDYGRGGELAVCFAEGVAERGIDDDQENATVSMGEWEIVILRQLNVKSSRLYLLMAPNGGDFFSNQSFVNLRTILKY